MEIRNKSPRPEKVLVYTFEFALHPKAIQIDVFPEQGDTATKDPDTGDFVFEFPRLNMIRVVEKAQRLGYELEETERLFVDSRKMQKEMVSELRKDIASKFSTQRKGRRESPTTTED